MENFTIDTTQNVSINTINSGIGKRFLAALVDMLVLIGLFIILNLILVTTNLVEFEYVSIFFSIIFFFYNFIFEVFTDGGSPGKASQRIKVVKVTGESASVFQYFIRALLRPIDIIMGVGLIVMIFNKYNQRLGDLIAGTTVIKSGEKISLEDTIMASVEEDYQPFLTRSQVEKLTPEHIEVIKKVYEQALKTREYDHFLKMHQKVLEITGAKHDLLPLEFIKRVIKDYTFYA